MPDSSPLKQSRGKQTDSASDQDFAGAGDSDGDDDSDLDALEVREGQYGTPQKSGTPRRGTAKLCISITPQLPFIKKAAAVIKPKRLQGEGLIRPRPTVTRRQQRPAKMLPVLGAKIDKGRRHRRTESSVQHKDQTSSIEHLVNFPATQSSMVHETEHTSKKSRLVKKENLPLRAQILDLAPSSLLESSSRRGPNN